MGGRREHVDEVSPTVLFDDPTRRSDIALGHEEHRTIVLKAAAADLKGALERIAEAVEDHLPCPSAFPTIRIPSVCHMRATPSAGIRVATWHDAAPAPGPHIVSVDVRARIHR